MLIWQILKQKYTNSQGCKELERWMWNKSSSIYEEQKRFAFTAYAIRCLGRHY